MNREQKQEKVKANRSSVGSGVVAKLAKMSDEELADLFASFFARIANGAKKLYIPEFECSVHREVKDAPVIEVRVFGMSGTTTQDEFCQKQNDKIQKVIEGGESVLVTLNDGTNVKFVLDDCRNANAMEYILVYKVAA